jgi:hypothetical protein
MQETPKLIFLRGTRRRAPLLTEAPPPMPQSEMLAALPAPREMHRRIQRERRLCDRGRPPFSVVVFDVGDPTVDDGLAVRLVEAFRRRARLSDEIGWFGRHRIAAMLPVTPHCGAHDFALGLARELADGGRPPTFQVFCL